MSRRYECPLYFPRVFGRRQCERIIKLGLDQPVDEGLVSGGASSDVEKRKDHLLRKAGVAWISPSDDNLWVFDKLSEIIHRANKTYQYDLQGFTEDAQFTCYDRVGDFYDWHQDGLEGELAVRKLSVVVQLSDAHDYEGADLELFGLSCEQEVADAWRQDLRRQGSAVVFPAFEYHRVRPLISGKRYSLVCWIGGPPFK
ncbi:MAG: 2OG-Fe(II) oxygenase [Pseudomonadales bacterium]|nr:2OG-Fe(II) oxygenase [Pseudomonadales bacterium]MBO7004263.1 2OG-Fe(II) oxygenase [Pseudomonadales bacterium]